MSLLATPAGVLNAAAAGSVAVSSSGSGSSSGNGSNNKSNSSLAFDKDKIWYFSNDQLENSPSRRCGIKYDDELHYRQMTAYLIQEMGQRLQVSQLCINTAIVYMHRFYAFHSFTHFHRNSMASASLFLAAKVEEQPRKLEHMIRAANKCLPQTTEQTYADLAQELVFNENVLLQTLGFDVAIDHPHTHVVRTCQLVKACKDLAQTSYFLASNSLHLTSMCLQYRPTVVACFCIYLACKWSRWEIPQSTEGKHWFYYVDKSVSLDLLKQLTEEFIAIYEKSPARLKSKLNSIKAIAQGASNHTGKNSKDNKQKEDWKISEMMRGYHSNITALPELMNDSECRDSSSQVTLLPPTAMVPAQQRRGDGTHQRLLSVGGAPCNLSSFTSSSSFKHKLQNVPVALPPEAHGDYKSKQPGNSSRPPSGHQSSSLSSAQRSSSCGSSTSGSSQRSSSCQPFGRLPMPMIYHKPPRGMPPVGMQPHGGHKMSTISKPQQPPPPLLDNRISLSASGASSSAGVKDVSKSSSSISGKLYPNAPPSSCNSVLPNPLMSRGSYHVGGGPGVGNNGAPPPSASYGCHISHRQKSVSSTSSSSSVHNMPPYEHQLSYLQTQGVPSCNLMQPQQHLPRFEAAAPSTPQLQQQQLNKNNSLFSSECRDIKKESQLNGLLLPLPSGPDHESLSYKLNNNVLDRDTPKRDRLTPTNKDKHRNALPQSVASGNPNAVKSMLPPHKKTHIELLAGQNLNDCDSGNLKRANKIYASQYGVNKLNESDGSLLRDKVRKLDKSVGLPGYPSYEEKHTPLAMSNGGIETTPDLVRSLLKESLCTTNTSLLKPDALTMPGLKPPAELLEPMPTPPHLHMMDSVGSPSSLACNSLFAAPTMEHHSQTTVGDATDLDGTGKSEKKKKKDKHKHKEKDKCKDKPDKEERKKHKKVKQNDRCGKDKVMDSLKLVIKTNTATANPNGLQVGVAAPLKLKFSKNKVELNCSAVGDMLPMHQSMVFGMAPPSVPGSSGNKYIDCDRDMKTKKSKTQDCAKEYAKYNGVAGGIYAPPCTGVAPNTQAPVSSLQGLPTTTTTASSTANTVVLATTSLVASIAPAALPMYNKN